MELTATWLKKVALPKQSLKHNTEVDMSVINYTTAPGIL